MDLSNILMGFSLLLEEIWPNIIGYSIAIFGGHWAIKVLLPPLQRVANIYPQERWLVLSTVQGYFERLLYALSWQYHHPEFIAIWLGLKVASNWKEWGWKPGYNLHLIGSALSVLFGILGALDITLINRGKTAEAILTPSFLLMGVHILGFWAYHESVTVFRASGLSGRLSRRNERTMNFMAKGFLVRSKKKRRFSS